MGFSVGDRVRIRIGAVDMDTLHVEEMRQFEGRLGTVVRIGANTCNCKVSVDGNGECWWWKSHALEPAVSSAPIPSPAWRIIIEGDENMCYAKYIAGKKVIKEVFAKRYYKDKHDPAMAARALIGKMFPEAKEPEKPKYFTGKAVCVEANTCVFEKGRIYDFSLNGGCGYNNITGNTILGSPVKSVEEINRRLASKFIEIKE